MASDTKSTAVKVKSSSTQDGPSRVKTDPSSLAKKKSQNLIKQPSADSRIKTITTITKSEVRSKTTPVMSKSITTTSTAIVKQKREKKVYSLPGQKYDIPEEREPLRMFYESLSKQIPSSEMAEFWLMEHGMLSAERARRAYEKRQRKQKQLRTGTPVKSLQASSKTESSRKQQQPPKNSNIQVKKKIIADSDDVEFILSPKRRKV